MNIRWDHFVNQYESSRYIATSDGRDNRHIQFVREFASVVSVLQVRWGPIFFIFVLMLTMPHKDKTNNVIDLYKDILRAVEDLTTCSYTSQAFSELLDKIQAAVRRFAASTVYGPNVGLSWTD
jgi:dynein heavy chain 1